MRVMLAIMEPMLEARGVTKRYGEVTALAALDLVAPAGEVLAVLGPNGAGKSTLVRMMATLTRPDAGALRVAGVDVARDPHRVRRLIGLAGQAAAVDPLLTGRENLRMIARLFGHRPAEAGAAAARILEQLGLTDAADRPVGTYSGGMRRRLDLGASLVGAPRILLLDEPTTGLDPRSRNELWQAIDALVAGGTDVVLTTQYLEEADRLADSVAILDHGRLVAAGTPDELKARVGRDVIDVRVREPRDLDRGAAALGPDTTVDRSRRRLSVAAPSGTDDLVAAVGALRHAGIAVEDAALRRPTLDDVFLALTGHTASDPSSDPSDQEAAA